MTVLPHVQLVTSLGVMVIALRERQAPASCASFLSHVDAGLYRKASFYRASRPDNEVQADAPVQLIQGGVGFMGGSFLPPVVHEPDTLTGLSPHLGAVGLARREPGSATSEFFICLSNNDVMRVGGARGDGLGVAIFGEIVAGLGVAQAIQAGNTGGEHADAPSTVWPQMLRRPVPIHDAIRTT